MPAGEDDFDEVLAAARAGAEWALTELYRSTHPGLIRYLHAHAAGEEEDLASDVWLEVAQGWTASPATLTASAGSCSRSPADGRSISAVSGLGAGQTRPTSPRCLGLCCID